MKHYTGVGLEIPPYNILNLIEKIAIKMREDSYHLRTGDAIGADSAFIIGAENVKDIYTTIDFTKEAMELAKKYHPTWNRLSYFAKKLHTRNAFQVLGKNLDKPSKFLICWTPDGCISHRYRTIKTGGTGTAISIASEWGIPVYNLKNKKTYNKFMKKINKEYNG